MTDTFYESLFCHQCERLFPTDVIQSHCPDCIQPLQAQYTLTPSRPYDIIHKNDMSMWRYRRLLPVREAANIVTLGEGWTPLLALKNTTARMGLANVWLKEEGNNPTGSFKARGISMAVSKAKELDKRVFCVPTAGNAGSALAAYTAAMGGEAHIFMPEATPRAFRLDCEVMGANITTVQGSIRDAGLSMQHANVNNDWWDISTLKEPFRLEGKKTMGYEIAEQLNWQLPDVILYPTGGGTGLIGIWKAFQEMLALGWITHIPTRMIAVQTTGCAPVIDAYEKGMTYCDLCTDPKETIANGLRVPKAFGDKLIMRALYNSGGCALAVTEQEMLDAIYHFGETEGLFLSPEGGAVVAAMHKLLESKQIRSADSVVIINTGSPYKYLENLP